MAKLHRALLGSFLFASLFLGATGAQAQSQFWQCVTFARAVSGIQIRGNAWTWWASAEGKYERGHTPKVGSVMVLKPGHGMRVGHVAMISSIVDSRTVLLTHANWSRRGQVERNVTAVDVSDAGDWSKVRVWYGPMNGLGISAYSTYGFIYPNGAPQSDRFDTTASSEDLDETPAVQVASAGR
jgi:surface antigen